MSTPYTTIALRVIPAFAFSCALAFAQTSVAQIATYRLTVNNVWSETTHPGNFPTDAHFSWIGGGTHSDTVSFWDAGALATPGIKQMAENGLTTLLVGEVETAITALALTSITFGLVHSVTRAYAVLATGIGLYLGGIMMLTESLLVPIVVHTLYDFVAFLVVLRRPATESQ